MSKRNNQQPSNCFQSLKTQTAIAKLGFDINAVMTLVAEQVQLITQAKGAIVELAEHGDDGLPCCIEWCNCISGFTF